jgi:hypothetical protein
MTTPDALHETIHHFYKRRDVELAVAGLRQLLEQPDPNRLNNAPVFHCFTRIAELLPAARAGFTALSPLHPEYVAALLQGSRHPNFPRPNAANPSPGDLDLFWAEFLVTGDEAPVRSIVAVLDSPDLVRERLTKWLKDTGTGFFGRRTIAKFQPVLVRCTFPIDYDARRVDGPLDCDLHVALNAKNGKLKFAELPFVLTQEELIHLATKSAAVWSLRVQAQQHELVARICDEEAKRPGGAARSHLATRAGA